MMTIQKFMARAGFGKAMLALLAVPMLLCAGAANSTTITVAHVNYVGLFGNGNLAILLDAPVAEPGCNASRVDIISTHPAIKNILATALTAKSLGSTVLVGTNGCFAFSSNGNNRNSPTMDTSNNSFFLIEP